MGPQLAGTTCVLGGVDVNSDPSRARGPGRRRPPRLRRRFVFSVVAGEARDGARALAAAAAAAPAAAALGREERGRIRVQPARNGMALSALTLIATPRAREGRGGADRRAYVADLFFLLSLVRRGMALGRWQLPLLRRRLLLTPDFFSVVAGEARDGARALAAAAAAAPAAAALGREERGRIRVQPARNGMALGASLREWDLNWLARHAFWAALTLIATPRAREGRGGADRRAYVADLFFLLSLVRRGMALGRWQLPLLRRRLLLRWVARNGVGFACSRLATGWHYRR